MTWAAVWQFAKDNEAVLALLGLAFVAKMPERLPQHWREILNWSWDWFRNGMLTFVNFRTPTSTQSVTYRQETPSVTTVQTSESKTDTPTAKDSVNEVAH